MLKLLGCRLFLRAVQSFPKSSLFHQPPTGAELSCSQQRPADGPRLGFVSCKTRSCFSIKLPVQILQTKVERTGRLVLVWGSSPARHWCCWEASAGIPSCSFTAGLPSPVFMVFKNLFSCLFVFLLAPASPPTWRNSLSSVKTEVRAGFSHVRVKSCGSRGRAGGQGARWHVVQESAPKVGHTVHIAKAASQTLGRSRGLPPPGGSPGAVTSCTV